MIPLLSVSVTAHTFAAPSCSSISFNKTTLSAIALDPISGLAYASVIPDYSSNYSPVSYLQRITVSTIYILDGSAGRINDIIKLRTGEQIHDMDINLYSVKIFAAGGYNYLNKSFEEYEKPIQYEDDALYIINDTNCSNNKNNTKLR